ncbi:MAG: NADH-quinone oxidoreductase subunit L [Chitinophagaceae bacterium]|nr:NADH-quinone oxidoreductase subunit L [Chitinophagaceae bacterium]
MLNLIWLVPLLPLLGFLTTGLFRNQLGKSAGWIASAAVFGSFIISCGIFNELRGSASEGFTYHVLDFIRLDSMHIPFNFYVDHLTSIFLLTVTGIGFLIHLYSIAYMSHDEGFGKFFSYLNLFIFSMLLLVLGSNYLIMFIGWEGVGLCSYLLIGFWYTNHDYTNAAKKAFVMNRIGDLGFLLGMFLIFSKFGTLEFTQLPELIATSSVSNSYLAAIGLCLFIGATGKSAQIPLFTWLPDAMAGPTPVSALIHAATMVTAGIFMITRSNFLYSLIPDIQHIILIVGLLTALIAATIATQQNDIKKVLAYSTVSQLGFMFMALGVGAYTAAVFHVITHAFFKALLFLGSGSVIHAMSGEQDIRKMGGLKKDLKITYFTFAIGCIAIAGIPPLSGFFSKDEIMMHVYSSGTYGKIYWVFGMLAALMTAYYMFRLLLITFFGSFRGTEHQKEHLHESPALMTMPLMLLALLSVIGGYIGIPAVLGHNLGIHHALEEFLEPVLVKGNTLHHASELGLSHSQELVLMALAVLIALIGIGLAYNAFKKYNPSKQSSGIARVFEDKWYFDEAYDRTMVKPLFHVSELNNEYTEKKGIDGLVNGIGKWIQYSSQKLKGLQSGLVGFYIFLMVIGMILLFVSQLWFNKI